MPLNATWSRPPTTTWSKEEVRSKQSLTSVVGEGHAGFSSQLLNEWEVEAQLVVMDPHLLYWQNQGQVSVFTPADTHTHTPLPQ